MEARLRPARPHAHQPRTAPGAGLPNAGALEGGLSKAALKSVNGIGSADGEETPPLRPRVPRLKPGTRLVREWHGDVHQVTVRDKGFEYRKEQYRSSAQAIGRVELDYRLALVS